MQDSQTQHPGEVDLDTPPQPVFRHQSRAKRPRFINANAVNGTRFTKECLIRPPSEISGLSTNPREPNASQVCAFCLIPGSMRECEGALVGPFDLVQKTTKRVTKFYAHRNCAIWAPQVFESSQGQLMNVDVALVRARLKKCLVCKGKGASLACMRMGSRCCRPMHFRCALRGGATLFDSFTTFCPLHSEYSDTTNELNPYHERTPVSDSVLRVNNGCTICQGDSYDRSRGTILTCNDCFGRIHTKCIGSIAELDHIFAANSFKGKHYCEKCMPCSICERRVDMRAYEAKRRQKSMLRDSELDWGPDQESSEDCNTILCVNCKHFAVHIDCLGNEDRSRWRCDLCRICRHCGKTDVSKDLWNERHEACPGCLKEISDGAVVCPVCEKLYKEHEGLPMIQCDDCDRWIHADTCGGLSSEKFKEIGKNSERYRCPLCVEKKRRETEKRRSKASARGERSSAQITSRSSVLNTLLKRVPLPGEECPFYNIQTPSKSAEEVPIKAMDDLAVDVEICRRCCSSSANDSLLCCINCGDTFHHHCIDHDFGNNIDVKVSETISRSVWQCGGCKNSWDMEFNPEPVSDPHGNIEPIDGNGSLPEFSKLTVVKNEFEPKTIFWDDKRRCELCERGERTGAVEGRLIVWGSSVNTDLSDCWVHVGCVLCSMGITMHRTGEKCDTILGPRRKILDFAKRSRCTVCGKNGATVKCYSKGCEKAFHLFCASASRARCVVKMRCEPDRRGLKNKGKWKNIGDVDNIFITCEKHMRNSKDISNRLQPVEEALRMMNMERMIRVIDSQGYMMSEDAAKARVVSMDRTVRMRVGSLTVVRFGEMIPEVNEFVVDGCLVPLGYCAARRYWSMRKVGQRCTYLLEVSGHAQSGPKFVIRCSDDLGFKVEEENVDTAWEYVWRKSMRTQLGRKLKEGSTLGQSGLEVFGLKNCESVLRHIESLPLSSMFGERYNRQWDMKFDNTGVNFYETLANNYVAPNVQVNRTGCARSEGYRRKNDLNKDELGPTYEHMRSGCAFQLQVAREMLCNKVEKRVRIPGHRSIAGISEKAINPANKRTKRVPSVGTNGDVNEDIKISIRANLADDVVIMIKRCGPSLAPRAKLRTKILRSEIDGWGVFATRDMAAGDLIIEYVGEVIRPPISDLRERQYLGMGVGCYMFEIVSGEIVDATLRGNAARYINHSCAPNCFSKKVAVDDGRQLVAIFAKRPIQRGEELSYDYQFPFDDSDRVKCGCGAERCRGYMN